MCPDIPTRRTCAYTSTSEASYGQNVKWAMLFHQGPCPLNAMAWIPMCIIYVLTQWCLEWTTGSCIWFVHQQNPTTIAVFLASQNGRRQRKVPMTPDSMTGGNERKAGKTKPGPNKDLTQYNIILLGRAPQACFQRNAGG